MKKKKMKIHDIKKFHKKNLLSQEIEDKIQNADPLQSDVPTT